MEPSARRRKRIATWRQAGRAAGLTHIVERSPAWEPGLLIAWAGAQKVRFEEYSPAKNQTGTRVIVESGRRPGSSPSPTPTRAARAWRTKILAAASPWPILVSGTRDPKGGRGSGVAALAPKDTIMAIMAIMASKLHHPRVAAVKMPTFTATTAKNEFGRVLDLAVEKGAVAITRHDARKAVLLSVAEYDALVAAGARTLETLTAEFDHLLAGMQSKAARKGMAEAFDATPTRLGRAAVAAAKKRG